MKKLLAILTAVVMVIGVALVAIAEQPSPVEAFNALFGATPETAQVKTPNDYLTEIIAGKYAAHPADDAAVLELASALPELVTITNADIAAYASANALSVKHVRNIYYRSLANALRAEIAVNPAAEEEYRNAQIVLALFMSDDDDDGARAAIRSSLTPEVAEALAAYYQLPVAFVEFIIMDDDWDDDIWYNDDDWREARGYDDSFDDIARGVKDDAATTRVAEMQVKLISLGYLSGKPDGVFGERTMQALMQFQRANGLPATGVYGSADAARLNSADAVARRDYQDSFDDSHDYYDTIDYPYSPDRDNTPDRINSPDYTNSPDRDNSPDRTNTPDRDNSPDYTNSPDRDNSPDPTKTPSRDNSPDYTNSPDRDNSPDPTDTPDRDNT